jgi:hypothetical protein
MSSLISSPGLTSPASNFTIVIHGGAGLISRSIDPNRYNYISSLQRSLLAGNPYTSLLQV